MSRTLLFLIILAALLCVGVSERDLRARIGLSGISSNKDEDKNENSFSKVLNFLHLSGKDAKGKGKGKGNDDNGKGHGGDGDEDCETSGWSSWNSCSRPCGGGVRYRDCTITRHPKGKGKKCGATHEEQPCNTHSCGVDCEVGEWQTWGDCSKTCGRGTQRRTRRITTQPSGGGRSCPKTDDDQPCNTQYCSVDCQVGEWESWGDCSKTCGRGTQRRTRRIITPASGGGRACPKTDDDQPCNTQYCSVDCQVGEWESWGDCSKTCGRGTQRRTRRITTPASGGGRACPKTDDDQPCNTQDCPVDCECGEWQSWGDCSKRCGGGYHRRSRPITRPPRHGGRQCPETEDNEPCNTHHC